MAKESKSFVGQAPLSEPPSPMLGGTMGSLFRAAREARGIPVEKAAHDTRIRAGRLREMESDDLSRMPPAYARMFLIDYARYLGIRRENLNDYLPETGELGVDGYDYILNAPANHAHSRRDSRPPRRRLYRPLTAMILAVAFLAGGFQLWVTKRKLDRISGSPPTESTLPAEPAPQPAAVSEAPIFSAPSGLLPSVFPAEPDAAFASGQRSDSTPSIR